MCRRGHVRSDSPRTALLPDKLYSPIYNIHNVQYVNKDTKSERRQYGSAADSGAVSEVEGSVDGADEAAVIGLLGGSKSRRKKKRGSRGGEQQRPRAFL